MLSLLKIFVILSGLFFSCNGAIRKDPTIYELSTRPWLYNLSQKYGRNLTKLSDIPFAEFQSLKDLGVDVVWLMGIWELGEYGLNYDQTNPSLQQTYSQNLPGWTMADVIGSPYAVVEFTCNPELGLDQDISSLKRQLNAIGLYLMLDFVPNHSAYDSPLVTSSIDMYMRAPQGTPTPYNSDTYFPDGIYYAGDIYGDKWPDVAQFNYWNPDTFNHMVDTVAHIASLADGIKCDMSMLIINSIINMDWSVSENSWGWKQPTQEFWTVAIKNAKKTYPNVIFLAESYWGTEQELVNLGFDYVYDKNLLDNMASFNIQNIANYLQSQSVNYLFHTNHFIENHDEPRAVALFQDDYKANTAAMIAYTIPGCKFVNDGQTQGFKNKLLVQLRRAEAESGSDYSRWWYSKLLPIINDDVFHTGNWEYLPVYNTSSYTLMSWKFTSTTTRRVTIVNFTPNQEFGQVILSDAQAPNGGDWYMITELMTGTQYNRSAQEMRTSGLGVVVPAWNGQIFAY
jgi:glycosidase